ncbi:MAG TPA: phage virion morphogenesis protein [Methylotenera sp.]|nr:phage virion morphogenesis protein [Methylotenera sp.]
MQLEFKIQDIDTLKSMQRIQSMLQHPDHLLKSLGESLLRVNKKRHAQGLAPDGTPWKPNAKSTYDAYASGLSKSSYGKDGRLNAKGATKVANKKPLHASGDMLNSLNYQVADNELKLGFDGERNAKLAFWHHGGTDPYLIQPLNKRALAFGGIVVKKVNHPGLTARPLLDMPASDLVLIQSVVADHLKVVLNRV